MRLDLDEIFELIDKVDQVKLEEFEYQDQEIKVKIAGSRQKARENEGLETWNQEEKKQEKKAAPERNRKPASEEAKSEELEEETLFEAVKSPMVGTFYQSAAPGEAPFVSVGDHVTKGQVIGIIEAMKLMNEIVSEVEGTVAEILVENEVVVEFEQPLILVQPVK